MFKQTTSLLECDVERALNHMNLPRTKAVLPRDYREPKNELEVYLIATARNPRIRGFAKVMERDFDHRLVLYGERKDGSPDDDSDLKLYMTEQGFEIEYSSVSMMGRQVGDPIITVVKPPTIVRRFELTAEKYLQSLNYILREEIDYLREQKEKLEQLMPINS